MHDVEMRSNDINTQENKTGCTHQSSNAQTIDEHSGNKRRVNDY